MNQDGYNGATNINNLITSNNNDNQEGTHSSHQKWRKHSFLLCAPLLTCKWVKVIKTDLNSQCSAKVVVLSRKMVFEKIQDLAVW